MFDDMAETVQNVGLAQSIQNGLAPSMQAKPKFGTPDAIAAKKTELTGASAVLPLYQTPLGRYVINNWAAANGVQLGSERRASVQRKSISGDASLAYSGSAPSEASLKSHWEVFSASPQMDIWAKYLTLYDNTPSVGPGDFHDMRPLGRGAFGAVSLVFKKDTGVPMATKAMVKKIVKKNNMFKDVQVEHDVLQKINSIFCVSLLYAWMDNRDFGLVLTLCPGGDLEFLLKNQGYEKDKNGNNKGDFKGLPGGLDTIKFYAASMALGLQCIHEAGYVYRDLKPMNVLLDAEGKVRISDLGLAKDISKGAISQCSGTRGFWSPETIKKEKYTTQPDWWSLGVTIYVLFSHKMPFHAAEDVDKKDEDAKHKSIDDATCAAVIDYKHGEPAELQEVVSALCTVDTSARLGCNGGASSLKSHAFWSGFNWDALEHGEMKAPIQPNINDINAPSKKDIDEFKEPKDVTWDAADTETFKDWNYVNKKCWEEEVIERIKKKKELEGGKGGGGGGCCMVQ